MNEEIAIIIKLLGVAFILSWMSYSLWDLRREEKVGGDAK